MRNNFSQKGIFPLKRLGLSGAIVLLGFLASTGPLGAEGTRTVSSGWLLEAARTTILTSEPWSGSEVTVQIDSYPQDIAVLREGAIEVVGTLERTPESLRDIGAVSIEVYVGGTLYMKFDPRPFITVSVPVLTAADDIERGQPISTNDLQTQLIDVRSLPSGQLPSSADELVGKCARVNIASGRVITLSMVELPILVHRGETVSVSVLLGSAALVLRGIALDSGALGDQIRVRNPDSQAIITATVTGPSQAEVNITP